MFKLITCFLLLWTGSHADDYTNPIALSAPDPWMEYYKGYYYLVATTWTNKIGIRKAKTLAGLHDVENEIVYTFDGHTLWAPEIHLVDGKWYLLYAACAPGTDEADVSCHRNHVAQSASDDPMGPYTFKSYRTSTTGIRYTEMKSDYFPSGLYRNRDAKDREVYPDRVRKLCTQADLDDPDDEDFELDPSYIIINDQQYLLGSYIRSVQNLYIRPMKNPYTPLGPKYFLSTPTYDWETQGANVNEGPEPLYHDGRIFVVYSASYCATPNYKLGLLEFVGTDPLNHTHWVKNPNPVFQRDDENHVYGPGHNGFFKSPDGKEDWIVYHANEKETQGCGMERSSRAQKFTWGDDGLPVFGVPEAMDVVYPGPSGE